MGIQHFAPEGLSRNPAFTPVISVPKDARMVFVGGQNAVDANGTIVGKGDLGAQTGKAIENLVIALGAASAKLDDLVSLRIYLVAGHPPMPGFAAWRSAWGARPNPTISVLSVVGLANPDFLVEIEAVAAVL